MRRKTTARTVILLAVVLCLTTLATVPAFADTATPTPSDAAWDVRFSGVITTVGDTGAAWKIGGQTLPTDANTRIVLTVKPAAEGQWADVSATRQADDSLLARQITVRPERIRLRGIVSSRPADITGDWMIAGVTVKATVDTKVSTTGGPVGVDHWVEAVLTETGGVLTATHLLGIGEQDAVMVYGEIQDVQAGEWLVSGIRLAVDNAEPDTTLISGAPAVGLLAQAAAELQADDTLAARSLRVMWSDRRAPVVADLEGKIESLPVYGLRGAWIVRGETVLVMPNAAIHQEKGLAVVGATVHVRGWQAHDVVIALEITVTASPAEGGEYTHLTGLIEGLPDEGFKGIWLMAGQQVVVDDRTLLLGAMPEVGKSARVEGVKHPSDSTVIATTVLVRSAPFSGWPPPRVPVGTPIP